MMVSSSFENDSVKIGWIQHDVYGDVISDLYKIAKRLYHQGEDVVGIASQLTKDSRDKNDFDHRNELERLVKKYPFIVRVILISATYPNPDERGIEAEEDIIILLRKEYQYRC